MTLLLTEIHNHDDPARTTIVFAADRRISVGSRYHGLRKKIFAIPRLNGAVGYFGLAQVGTQPMADWLAAHLRRESSSRFLGDFAKDLADRLNVDVPSIHRRTVVSGFHIAGFDPQARAEFWFVRNIMDDYQPTGSYAARDDFQGRDAANLQPGHVQIYRNGDILPHVLLWTTLDEALSPLFNRADFRRVRTISDYADWVRFKLEIITYVYKKWCTASIVGRPIDVLCLRAKAGV